MAQDKVDAAEQTKTVEPAKTPALLSEFDEIKLPDPRLGAFFAPTLKDFFEALKKRGGQPGGDVAKLLPQG